MGKRNYKPNVAKKPGELRRPGTKQPLQSKNRASSGKSVKTGARAYDKPAAKTAAPVSVLTVRITAAVVALLALGGGVTWGVLAQKAVNAGVIVGLVALGVIAGLAIFAAVRSDIVAARMATMLKR